MEFNLNDYHRNTSDEDLIFDVQRVASTIGTSSLTIDQYKAHGKYGITTLRRHFGSWEKVLEICGIAPTPLQKAAMSNKNATNNYIPDEVLIADLQRVAVLLKQDTLNSHQYMDHGLYSVTTCSKRFHGWDNALITAGLSPNKDVPGKSISTNDLFQEIERIWILLGRQPTSTDIKKGISKYSLQSYSRRFGGWRGALKAFVNWVNSDSDKEKKKKKANPFPHPQVTRLCRKKIPSNLIRPLAISISVFAFALCSAIISNAVCAGLLLQKTHLLFSISIILFHGQKAAKQ